MLECEPTPISIAARSKRQALDWSLVLASQSIEVSIQRDPSTGRFSLMVEESDHNRALASIQQYQAENPRSNWIASLHPQNFEFHGAGGWWSALMLLVFLLQVGAPWFPEDAAVMDSRLVRAGQWWRLLSATWLHQDIAHLASNLSFGFLFLGIAIPRYGIGLTFLVSLISGAAGNLTGLWLHAADYRGLGASGSVMGLLGLLAMQAWPGWIARSEWVRALLSTFGGGACVLLIIGMDPHADVIAHVGGFLAGSVFGGFLSWAPARTLNSKLWNRSCLSLCLLLTLACWLRIARSL